MYSDMRVTRTILLIRTQTKLVNLKEKAFKLCGKKQVGTVLQLNSFEKKASFNRIIKRTTV